MLVLQKKSMYLAQVKWYVTAWLGQVSELTQLSARWVRALSELWKWIELVRAFLPAYQLLTEDFARMAEKSVEDHNRGKPLYVNFEFD